MTTTRPHNSRLLAAALSLVAIAAIVTACSSALNRGGTAPVARETRSTSQAEKPAVSALPYFEFQLDEPVRRAPETSRVIYPVVQKAAGIESEVLVQVIVDADGAVEPGSFKVLKSSIVGVDTKSSVVGVAPTGKATDANAADRAAFEAAVRDAMATARFIPGKLRGTPVRQLVQMPFVFSIAK